MSLTRRDLIAVLGVAGASALTATRADARPLGSGSVALTTVKRSPRAAATPAQAKFVLGSTEPTWSNSG